MARAVWKGPFVEESLMKKVANIFHIETKKIKKNEDINANKIKFLVFIHSLS